MSPNLRVSTHPLAASLASALVLAWPGAAMARDPMQALPEARPPAPRASAADGSTASGEARHILVVDGKRFVIDAGRRRAVGDLLGGARIERIEDSAVVVREAGNLQRLPLYGNVIKRPSIDGLPLVAASPAASAALRPRLSLRSALPSVRSGELQ